MERSFSVNGIPIRLTQERWEHIVTNKPYMDSYYERIFEAIERPTFVLQGYSNSLVAVLGLGKNNYLHVVYKELNEYDGFVITAFIARKYNRRKIIWRQEY